jgi:cytochrome c oxidase assembly protein subunit 19
MSTPGSPGGAQKFSKPIPPERGSFPLDHDAECQHVMKQYLRCIRSHKGINDDECRELSKGYLQCRMERNLMAVDSMKNLGFQDLEKARAGGVGEGKDG